MKEISADQVEEKARRWQAGGKQWPCHMLTPDCQLNECDQQAFVLENRTDDETFVVYSEERLMSLGQRLVKLLHGEKILSEDTSEITSETMKHISARAREANEKGVHWHHHMLFPDCIFNKHGKWVIRGQGEDL